jgi:hypothetical protein
MLTMKNPEGQRAPRRRRLVWIALPTAALVTVSALAHAQLTGPTTSDTVIGAALNTLGNTVALLTVQVARLEAADHTHRLTLSGSGTILGQDAPWLTRVDHPAAGLYELTFAPGAFAAAPTCVVSALAVPPVAPSAIVGGLTATAVAGCTPTTISGVTCKTWLAGVNGPTPDVGLSLVCVGP